MSPSSVCARRHFHVGPVSAGLENLPRALDPRRILFPQSTLPSFRCPARNNSARVPSPMDGADASSPTRGQRVHWTLAFRVLRGAPATSPAHSASSPSTEQSVQHSHSIPALARRVYSLLSVSSESSSPVNSPATVHLRPKPHPEHHLDVIKRPEFLPCEPDASPTSPSSSRRAIDDPEAFTEPLRVILSEHRRPTAERLLSTSTSTSRHSVRLPASLCCSHVLLVRP